MTQLLQIHPEDPQPRLIAQVVAVLNAGGVIAYPTDGAYALGCCLGDKPGGQRIQRIRALSKTHNFTLICRNLAELSSYAKIDNPTFRMLKAHTPGPYTFVLNATKEVPRRLQNSKRKTIGLRVPDHPVVAAILAELGMALMSVTLIMPGDDFPLVAAEDIFDRLQGQVEIVIDSGRCGVEPTSVIDLTCGVPDILRVGKGDVSDFIR
ncbi:MAG: threonylcarbamoyl-AMP synthase [Gammaproteobacteria bacterium]|nr:threonylcarbamoyl-AMP synthase [Gammaproteobacteria bacterium]